MNTAPLPRILIVDDEATNMRVLCDTLRDQGYETEGCTAGEDALKALQEQQFDLLLTDLVMPGMDGVELLTAALKIDPHLVGILMTGKGTIEAAVAAMKAGALDFVLKPVKLSAILPVLARAASVRLLRLENLELRNTVAIHELNQAIAHTLDPNVLLDKIADAALAQFEADEASIMLLTEDGCWLYVAAVRGAGRDALLGTLLQVGKGIAGWVAAHREPLVREGEVKDTLPAPLHPRPEIQSAMSMPMITRGKLVGVINVNSTRRHQAFPAGQVKVLSIFTNAAATGIEAARLYEEQHRADARYREVLDMAADGIVSIDEEQRIIIFNRGAEQVFGYGAGEVLGKPLDLLLPAEAAEAHRHHVQAFGEGPDQSRTMDMRGKRLFGRRKDGTLINVEVSISKRSENGRKLYTAVVHDITRRVRQEDKIARLSRIHQVLSGINSAIVRIRDRAELFQEACRIAVEHGGFGIAWIGAYDPAMQEVTPLAWAGIEAGEYLGGVKTAIRSDLPQGRGLLAQAIKSRKPVFDNDITVNPETGGARRAEAIRRGYRSAITLPLIVEGEVTGSLSLFANELNFFDEEEIKLLVELAGDVAFALEHIIKEERLDKLSRIRAVSSEINAAIVRIRERDALLQETCRIAAEHGKFEFTWVAAIDQEKQQIRTVAWTGFSAETAHAPTWAGISAVRGGLADAIRTRNASVRNDIESEVQGGPLRQEALKNGCHSTVCLPLVVDDSVVGLIALFATERGFFDDDEIALLNELMADISFALQSIARQEKVDYLSYYDALTGLPNRTLFNDRLEQRVSAARHDRKIFAVVMLDLERFRNINETLGRQAGDDLIRQVGQRLKNALEETSILAHIGGDHFAIASQRIDEAESVGHFLDIILAAIHDRPFQVDGNELRVAARAGIAVFPEDGADLEILLRNAEAAQKKAKASGDRYLFYQPKMNAAVAQNLLLENKLRQALDKEQFVLHYQPKVDLATGTISGLEALIRWNDPETGLVPPIRFIPLLEETGMILEVGRWAIFKALYDYGKWFALGLNPPRIAVNVSPVQLRHKNFVEDVHDALQRHHGSPHGLDLEITESLIMEDIQDSIRKLSAVRDMGLTIAIDDFGTGYSSLGYLAKLPVSALKIDRSFIMTMTESAGSMTIVSSIISMTHGLNLKVIAEGVESEEQRSLLKLLKCDEMQGYLFSRPLPAAEIEAKFLGAAAAT